MSFVHFLNPEIKETLLFVRYPAPKIRKGLAINTNQNICLFFLTFFLNGNNEYYIKENTSKIEKKKKIQNLEIQNYTF